MAMAFIVTLEKQLPGQAAYAKGATGKALARESDKLDSVARRRNVSPITSLLSENPATVIEQLKADGFDPSKMRVPPEQWYAASEGLKTTRALTQPSHFGDSNCVLGVGNAVLTRKVCTTKVRASRSPPVRAGRRGSWAGAAGAAPSPASPGSSAAGPAARCAGASPALSHR